MQLERIQRRATKYILGNYSSSYKERLQSLDMLPLMYWLELNDIVYFISAIKYPSDNVSILQYVSFSNLSTQSSVQHKLKHNFCRTTTSHHFYFNRHVRLWNKLPAINITRSVPLIKREIINHLRNHF